MRKIAATVLVQIALIGMLSSCSDSSTNPSSSTEILGTWIKVTTDSMNVTDDTAGVIGKTVVTETYTMSIIDGGLLKTTIKEEFNPQIASAKNSEISYTGTWRTSNDTLYRDSYPGALGSLDTSAYSTQYNTLTLHSIRATSSMYFTRAK
jgi:hypothetical protein